MPSSIYPLALLVPRPQMPIATIPPSSPSQHRLSNPASLPKTPQRSPAVSHSFLSPPAAHRNSTDSWNSSNYDLDAPITEWKDDEIRLLSRTLDALPAHLLTPFNGPVPPLNLLDKIARGIAAAKGPNDWPHTVRVTRARLLEIARHKAQEDAPHLPAQTTHALSLGHVAPRSAPRKGEKRARTPDPVEVLQPRTNTPLTSRRALYRKSSMDFMSAATPDRHESIARLSNRFQRHDRTLHHPYHRPAHLRHRSEHANAHALSPSTPSSSTLGSNDKMHLRKSTASATSASTSSFGSPMSICAPLRPSSLRRASTFTLASTSDMPENPVQRVADLHPDPRSAEAAKGASKAKPVKARSPTCSISATSAPKLQKLGKPSTTSALPNKAKPRGEVDVFSPPETPPPETCALANEDRVTNTTSTPLHGHARKARKGHKTQVSLTSDEEYKERIKSAKKVRTRAPSSLLSSPSPAPVIAAVPASVSAPGEPLFVSPPLTAAPAPLRAKTSSESGRSTSTGGSKSSRSGSSRTFTENELSTASTDTAPTSVGSAAAGRGPFLKPKTSRVASTPRIPGTPRDVSQGEQKRAVRRNLARNPSMFGPELPNPQKTPRSPARIPVSSPPLCGASPVPVLSPAALSAVTSSAPLLPSALSFVASSPAVLRPHTLRRAARRIEFGSIQPSRMSPDQDAPSREAGAPALGSAFQLA